MSVFNIWGNWGTGKLGNCLDLQLVSGRPTIYTQATWFQSLSSAAYLKFFSSFACTAHLSTSYFETSIQLLGDDKTYLSLFPSARLIT